MPKAGFTSRPKAAAILAEFGVEVVARNVMPKPGQTRALASVQRILQKRGEGHLRLVLATLAETENNAALLNEVGLWATSDLVLACPRLVENHTSDWLDFWDQIPLVDIYEVVRSLHGIVSQRAALIGMVYERILRRFSRFTPTKPGEIADALSDELLKKVAHEVEKRKAKREAIDIEAIAAACGVRLPPLKKASPNLIPRDCFARETLRKVGREHGATHLERVLRLIVESKGNAASLHSDVITAVSDLLASPLVDSVADLAAAVDRIDLERLAVWARGVQGSQPASDVILAVLKHEIIGPDRLLRPETEDERRQRIARQKQASHRERYRRTRARNRQNAAGAPEARAA